MYELMWNVTDFVNDKNAWPTDGSNPYVYSMNIGGPAAHGDYVFGWKGNTLQAAMDNQCNLDATCAKAGITKQATATYNACQVKQKSVEKVDGWLAALPVGQPAVRA